MPNSCHRRPPNAKCDPFFNFQDLFLHLSLSQEIPHIQIAALAQFPYKWQWLVQRELHCQSGGVSPLRIHERQSLDQQTSRHGLLASARVDSHYNDGELCWPESPGRARCFSSSTHRLPLSCPQVSQENGVRTCRGRRAQSQTAKGLGPWHFRPHPEDRAWPAERWAEECVPDWPE